MKKIILLAITFISFTSLKNYSQSDSVFAYVPLDIGNHWQYRVLHIVYGPPHTDTTTYYSISTVERDTIMPNGYKYRVINNTESSTRYVHIDSSTACVYEYAGDSSRGLITDSLKCSPGDWFGLDNHCEFIDTATILNYWTWVMGVDRSLPDITEKHALAMDIGRIYKYKYESLGWGIETIGNLEYARINGVEYGTLVNVETKEPQVDNFMLYQNFPNPFNPITKIKYSVSEISNVVVKIFDILGNDIETLVNEQKPAGNFVEVFDGTGLPSGIYFYQLKTDEYIETKKMILLK